MKIQIFNYDFKNNLVDSLECTFYHDINGNLFLKTNDKYFVLFISATDDIEWIELNNYQNLVEVNSTIKYSSIKNTYEKKSLKGKITKELEDDGENDDNVDETDEQIYYKNKYKAYPEEKLYIIQDETTNGAIATDGTNEIDEIDDIYDDMNNADADGMEVYYKFSKFGDESVIKCLDRSLEVLANYDTFIMNDNTSYVLATLQASQKSEYRVSLFVTGKMLLNIVGSKIKWYDIYYKKNDTDISIICENSNTKIVM